MNISVRLNALPENVKQTFHKDFVFLIFPDKIQHFPARNWTKEQILEKLHEYLGTTIDYQQWQDHLIASSPDKKMAILLPNRHML